MDIELGKKLICIACRNSALQQKQNELVCSVCGEVVSLHNGIPDFLSPTCKKELSWKDENFDPLSYESTVSQIEPYRLRRIDEPLLYYARGEVLEIGCGTCRLGTSVERRQAKYFGLDPLLSFLLYAQGHRGF